MPETTDPRLAEAARMMGERDGKYGLDHFYETTPDVYAPRELRDAYDAAYQAAKTES